jgi:hypothetical protein
MSVYLFSRILICETYFNSAPFLCIHLCPHLRTVTSSLLFKQGKMNLILRLVQIYVNNDLLTDRVHAGTRKEETRIACKINHNKPTKPKAELNM